MAASMRPSPLAGEGGPRSGSDGGAVSAAALSETSVNLTSLSVSPHPSGSACHLPPQGGKEFV